MVKQKDVKEEINLKTLSIIFILSLLILFISYALFHTTPFFLIRHYRIDPLAVNNNLLSVNGFPLQNIELEGCPNCTKSYYFEEGDYFVFEYHIPYKNKINLFFRKVLYHIYGIPDHGWVSIDFEPSNTDWSEYNSINFFVKGTGEPSELEFVIEEADGDMWHFFDEEILKTEKLTLVNISFEHIIRSKESLGDGKKDFHNVKMFQLVITCPNRAVNNTLYFALKNNTMFYLL